MHDLIDRGLGVRVSWLLIAAGTAVWATGVVWLVSFHHHGPVLLRLAGCVVVITGASIGAVGFVLGPLMRWVEK